MPRVPSDLVRHLSRVAPGDSLDDHELLRCFAAERDGAAFEVLVRRHGPVVFGVCIRLLGRGGDADDAFQATFLALVRHARSVRSDGSLAGWLHRVARRVCVRAARRRASRAEREWRVARPEGVTTDAVERADWRAHLDREVGRLPRPYREAFVLCVLDERPHEDAARELGCPLGTLHSRLARAKDRLRARLGAVPVVAAVAVSAPLTRATTAAAVGFTGGVTGVASPAILALSQGVWNPMISIKTTITALAVSAATVLGSGVVLLPHPTAAATQPPAGPSVEELQREVERLRREVTELRRQLVAAEERKTGAPVGPVRAADAPSDADVLRALPREVTDALRGNPTDIVIVKNKIVDRLGAYANLPLLGEARVRHQHWECVVYYTDLRAAGGGIVRPRTTVVYLDRDRLVPVADAEQ